MTDVILTDGTEITFDLRSFSYEEYEALFTKNESDEHGDQTIARACHMDYEQVFRKLNFHDYKLVVKHFFRVCREPLQDPNSPSASISP